VTTDERVAAAMAALPPGFKRGFDVAFANDPVELEDVVRHYIEINRGVQALELDTSEAEQWQAALDTAWKAALRR
jgi:hypothetical protein